jgi:molybdate transport system permease protein
VIIAPSDLQAIWLTIQLAGLATAILVVIGIPFAWWLARTRFPFKVVVEAVVALPLVLPPTVLGFYLLVTLGPHGPIGGLVKWLGGPNLAFSFGGLLIGSVFYSLPFVVQPIQTAFSSIDDRLLEMASTLRAQPLDSFFHIVLPIARPGVITAATLGFAHTLGEFGVVLMIGGNLPGKTQVLSIAIYDHVESLEYSQAHWLSGGLLLFSFLLLFFIYRNNLRRRLFMRGQS